VRERTGTESTLTVSQHYRPRRSRSRNTPSAVRTHNCSINLRFSMASGINIYSVFWISKI